MKDLLFMLRQALLRDDVENRTSPKGFNLARDHVYFLRVVVTV